LLKEKKKLVGDIYMGVYHNDRKKDRSRKI